MSRFFNETRKVVDRIPADAPATDIEQRVDSLKQSMESPGSPAQNSSEPRLGPVPAPDRPSEVVVPSPVARLENCDALRLPRDQEKSFLMAQYSPPMQAAVEAYQTLRTRLVKRQDKQGMRSLVVSSAAPGEGKTLTTFNLALCFAKIQNWPVLLIDADLRTQGLSRLAGNPRSPGLAQVLEAGCSYEEAILRTDVPNLYILPAGEASLSPPELFCRTNWKDLIAWGSEVFKLVLIDSPPALNLADFELIAAACESVVLIVRAGKTSRESLIQACAHLDAGKLTGVIYNATEDKPEHGYYRYIPKSP